MMPRALGRGFQVLIGTPCCSLICLCWLSTSLCAQAADTTGQDLSTLDLDQLARIKVTAGARRPEPVAQASAAVAVISREDIRRSGAVSLPEALRLLPGLAVAQAGTRDWAVSSRGFNEQTSNKMLVLVDGRVVYSPIFAGVFWDVQRVPLEDVDRIELIRGPGAALWGANAVNGVINVVTRPATETRGGVASLLGGTNDQAQADVRYGAGLGRHGAIRGYGIASTEGASDLEDGAPAADNARVIQGGFRADLNPQPGQSFTFQGDIYGGKGGNLLTLPQPTAPFVSAIAEDLHTRGGNLLGRWQRQFSASSDLAVQAYFDHASRSQPAFFGRISVTTFDLDFQHHLVVGGKHDVVWGLGYRLISDTVTGAFTASFDPPARTVSLVTGFLQDQLVVIPDHLALNVGSKFEHNDYTGFELQPTGRILWTPNLSTTLWGAVSRAVRTPSRLDSDIDIVAQVADIPPLTQVVLRGNKELEAEELVAYEAGYRMVPHERLSIDVTGYYHQYHRLRSFVPQPPESAGGTTVVPYMVTNNARSRTVGGTASVTVRLSPWWRMRASYTYLDQNSGLEDDAPAGAIPDVNPKYNPSHQVGLWTSFDLPHNLELDVFGRYVSSLDIAPPVADYLQADSQLGWRIGETVRVALIGRDLLSPRHVEFPQAGFTAQRRAIERQLRVKAVWLF